MVQRAMVKRYRLLVAWLGLSTLLIVAGGCSSAPYDTAYSFYPKPAMVEVLRAGSGGAQQTPLTVFVSVLGVRRADPARHVPHSIAIRMRLENNGPAAVEFDPGTMELVTGALRTFPPPQTRPAGAITLSASQRQEVNVLFPFPPNTSARDMNLNTLRLRWQVIINSQPVVQTAFFERVAPDRAYDASDSDLYAAP